MGQPDTATGRDTAAGTLPPVSAQAWRVSETTPNASAATRAGETLRWSELTYRDQTFVFNRELVVRVTQEDGGWSFESDDPELFGFGHTRSEAELVFCLDLALCWDEIACEADEKLSRGAMELKRALLALVSRPQIK